MTQKKKKKKKKKKILLFVLEAQHLLLLVLFQSFFCQVFAEEAHYPGRIVSIRPWIPDLPLDLRSAPGSFRTQMEQVEKATYLERNLSCFFFFATGIFCSCFAS